MKNLPKDIYQKIHEIDAQVKSKLRRKGIVVPVRTNDGTVRVGNYFIKKDSSGFFSINDYTNEPIIDKINLPQSAALLANGLALGKFIDNNILSADRKYGHALFEEEYGKFLAHKTAKKNAFDRLDIYLTKSNIAKLKKEYYKTQVLKGFEKLMLFR